MAREAVWWRSGWNGALAVAARFGWRGTLVQADELLARASKVTALDDFGDMEFLEPMRLLIGEFESRAAADEAGRYVFSQFLLNSLTNRLRIREAIRKHPDIVRQAVVGPLFVVGLPRTGTTLLQGLLAGAGGMRTPLLWETSLGEAVPGTADDGQIKSQVKAAKAQANAVNALSPALAMAHEIGALLPEECNPLLMTSFRALLPGLLFDCPDYLDHVYASRFRNSYEWHKLHLQVLAYLQPAATWTLKGPVHMGSLDELLRVYPDARIIFTHRDPLESIPSMAGLAACMRMLVSPTQDKFGIGRELIGSLSRMHEAALVSRERWPPWAPRFVDVRYDELVRDPRGTVRGILRHFGLPQRDDLDSTIATHLREYRQHRRGRHRYRGADFGLEEAQIRKAFHRELDWLGQNMREAVRTA